jgi:hypothetical protein
MPSLSGVVTVRSAALLTAALALASLTAASEVPEPDGLTDVAASGMGHAGGSRTPSALLRPLPELRPTLRLVWVDPSGIAFGSEAVTKAEVVSLLRDLGVQASWRRGEAQEIARADELRVIFLNRCGTRRGGVSVLGATPVHFDSDPHLWVHVPSVGEAVGVDPLVAGSTLDPRVTRRLGIGIARVVAHEVVHALLPSLRHGRGLMAARLDLETLTAPTIPADPGLSRALRGAWSEARARDALRAGTGDELLAAQSYREESLR